MLDEKSFICAGSEEGKDACVGELQLEKPWISWFFITIIIGDGGAGLTCNIVSVSN